MDTMNHYNVIQKFINGMRYDELLEASGFISELYYGNDISDVQNRANQSSKKVAALVEYVSSNSDIFSDAKRQVDQRVVEVSASSSEKSASSRKAKKEEQLIDNLLSNYNLKNTDENENALKALLDLAELFIGKGESYSAITLLKKIQKHINDTDTHYPIVDVRLLRSLGSAYRNAGNIEESIYYLNKCHKVCEALGSEIEMGLTYKELALSCQEAGNYAEALIYARNAYKIISATDAHNSTNMLSIGTLLASILIHMGRYHEAIACIEQIIAIGENSADHMSLASAYNNLSVVYHRIRDYDHALFCANKALELYHELGISEQPAVASVYNNIAVIYREKGDYSAATNYLRQAQKINEKSFGLSSTETATTYSNLAGVYLAQGEYEQALEYYEKAYGIDTKILGFGHPDVGVLCSNIGYIYLLTGNYTIAYDWYETANRIFREHLGPEHPYAREASAAMQQAKDYAAASAPQ